ncbi:hypothetical protein [Microcoleus sp. FACHB-831]|nr:hypothetical protein [Microcoleus sp. FACHB-831]
MNLGNAASWLAGVAAGAMVVCWMVIPGMVGLGQYFSVKPKIR